MEFGVTSLLGAVESCSDDHRRVGDVGAVGATEEAEGEFGVTDHGGDESDVTTRGEGGDGGVVVGGGDTPVAGAGVSGRGEREEGGEVLEGGEGGGGVESLSEVSGGRGEEGGWRYGVRVVFFLFVLFEVLEMSMSGVVGVRE